MECVGNDMFEPRKGVDDHTNDIESNPTISRAYPTHATTSREHTQQYRESLPTFHSDPTRCNLVIHSTHTQNKIPEVSELGFSVYPSVKGRNRLSVIHPPYIRWMSTLFFSTHFPTCFVIFLVYSVFCVFRLLCIQILEHATTHVGVG